MLTNVRYKNFKRLTEGFKPGASSCRNESGNLVTAAQGLLSLCRHHSFMLLRGNGDIICATREDSEPAPIDDDEEVIPPPSHNEVRVAKHTYLAQTPEIGQGLGRFLSCGARKQEQT